MDPIIEILSKNIIQDKRISRNDKEQFIFLINRISSFKTTAQQLYRQNAFHPLYNAFNEEILFLTEQKNIFAQKLTGNSQIIISEFINSLIDLYNHYLTRL